MRKRLTGFILLSVMLMLASGAFAASLSLSPNPASPSLGQNFVIALNLDTATQTKGFSIRFHYDSSVLSFVQANRGPLFTGYNVGWWRVFNGPPNEDPGVVRIECIIFGNGMYTTGPGNLLNLTFNAVAQGYSDFHLSDVDIFASNGSVTYNNSWNDGSIIVGSGSCYTSAMVLLEGPFNGDGMNCLLQDKLPLVSPYASAPETLAASQPGMVDWVLLELLDSPNGNVIFSRSLLLYQDGRICSPLKPYIMMSGAPSQGYYIRIKHRNHQSLSSSEPISFIATGDPVLHDLRQAALINIGSGVKNLGGDLWAMKAGDANADGMIDQNDHYLQWRSQAGISGYLSADFDLDGFVFPNDLLDLWRPNAYPLTMPPLNPIACSLSFTTADLQVEPLPEGDLLSMSIRVTAGSEATRLGTGLVILNYDGLSFGSNIVAQNRITITPGNLLESANPSYSLIIRDLTENRLAVIYDFEGDSAYSSLVPTIATNLLHLSIQLQNTESPTGFEFDELMMQNQQYQSDYCSLYSPVFANAINGVIPSPPADLAACSSEGHTILNWTSINGYTYNIYSKSPQSPAWLPVAEGIDGNTWTDLSTESVKFYKITANSGRGD